MHDWAQYQQPYPTMLTPSPLHLVGAHRSGSSSEDSSVIASVADRLSQRTIDAREGKQSNDKEDPLLEFDLDGVSLQYLLDYVDSCGGRSAFDGLTTHDVSLQLVKPQTAESKTSVCKSLKASGRTDVVAKSNWFVSHVWSYRFLNVVDALANYFSDQDKTNIYIWFDLFSTSQHDEPGKSVEWFTNSYAKAIKTIQNFVVVLHPWKDSTLLTRAWCLFEIHASKSAEKELNVAMTADQQQSLAKPSREDLEAFLHTLTEIESEKSEATDQEVKTNLLKSIESIGFEDVGDAVFDNIGDWMLSILSRSPDAKENLDYAKFKAELADIYLGAEIHDKALELALDSFEARTSVLGLDDPVTILSAKLLLEIYVAQEHYEKAEDLAKKYQGLGKTVADNSEFIISLENLATSFRDNERADRAEPILLQVLELKTASSGRNSEEVRKTVETLSWVYETLGNSSKVIEYALEAYEISKVVYGEDSETSNSLLFQAGKRCHEQNLYEKAEPLFAAFVRSMKRMYGDGYPASITSMINLAGVYRYQGLYDKSEALYLASIEKSKADYGEDSDTTISTLVLLCNMYDEKGDIPTGIKYYLDALARLERSEGVNYPGKSSYIHNLGGMYERSDDLENAEKCFEESLEIERSESQGLNYTDLISLESVARVKTMRGLHNEAEALLRECLESRKEQYGPNHVDTLRSMYDLGNSCEAQSKFEEAEALYADCIEMRIKVSGEYDYQTIAVTQRLAQMYKKLSRFSDAESFFMDTLDRQRFSRGDDDYYTIMVAIELAEVYIAQKLYQKADILLEDSITKLKHNYSDTFKDVVRARKILEDMRAARDADGFTPSQSIELAPLESIGVRSANTLNLKASTVASEAEKVDETKYFPLEGVSLRYLLDYVRACGGRPAFEGLSTQDVCTKFIQPQTQHTSRSACQTLISAGRTDVVANATWFVSHVWRYPFLDVIDSLESFFVGQDATQVYLWFDLFSNSQHNTASRPFEWWKTTFMNAIKTIRNFVVVLQPWDNPEPLTRVWCVFEVYSCHITGSNFHVAMAPREEKRLANVCTEDFGAFQTVLSKVDSRNSNAVNLNDKELIFQVIQSTSGFDALDRLLFDIFGKWILGTLQNRIAKASGYADIATWKAALGKLYEAQGVYEKAETLSVESYDLRKQILGEDDPLTISSACCVADIYRAQSKYSKAEELYSDSYERRKRLLGEDNFDTIVCQEDIAMTYWKKGDYERAESMLKDILERKRRVFGEKYESVVDTQENLGRLQIIKGDFAETEPLALKSYERSKRLHGENHTTTVGYLNNVGALYYKHGLFEKAEEIFKSCVKTRNRTLGAKHPSSLRSLHNLAACHKAQGEFSLAEPVYVEVLEKRKEVLGEDHLDTIVAISSLAKLYKSDIKDYSKAENYYLELFEARRRVLGTDHLETQAAIMLLVNLYQFHIKQDAKATEMRIKLTEIQNSTKTLVELTDSLISGLEKDETLDLEFVEGQRRTLGKDFTKTMNGLFDLAEIYERNNEDDKAITAYLEAIEGSEQATGKNFPYREVHYYNLGRVYEKHNNLVETERCYMVAVETIRAKFKDVNTDDLGFIDELAGIKVRLESFEDAEALYRESFERRKAVFGIDKKETIDSMVRLANVYKRMGRNDAAVELLEDCLAGRKTGSDDESQIELAALYVTLNQLDKAKALYIEYLQWKRSQGKDFSRAASRLFDLAEIYERNNDDDKAIATYLEAIEGSEQALGKNFPYREIHYYNLGRVYEKCNNLVETERCYIAAVETIRAKSKEISTDDLGFIDDLGGIKVKLGSLEGAEALYRESFERRREVFGIDKKETIDSMVKLANVCKSMGRNDAAAELFEDCLTGRRTLYGADDEKTLAILTELGTLYVVLNQFDKAKDVYTECFERQTRTLGENAVATVNTLNGLANLFKSQIADYGKAEALYIDLVAKRKISAGEDHAVTIHNMNELADLYYTHLGDFKKAEPLYLEVIEKKRRTMGEDNIDVVLALFSMAERYALANWLDKAIATYVEALDKAECTMGKEYPGKELYQEKLDALYKYKNQPNPIAEIPKQDEPKTLNEVTKPSATTSNEEVGKPIETVPSDEMQSQAKRDDFIKSLPPRTSSRVPYIGGDVFGSSSNVGQLSQSPKPTTSKVTFFSFD
ncbi:Kinesin light chain 3 [Phlyctochytrium planicorne]|nr:Kinesin light chain 3 [Phlyctochytrium planicorne]